jgi:acyl-CoA reductase-like NAD-dependent aldehyde dehydrogenase
MPEPRVEVKKTCKLFIGGAFPRSESGRSYVADAADGRFLANVAWASRKDVRDAVGAARASLPTWSGATAYNRGQVLYRVAELLEDRRDQFVSAVRDAEGATARAASAQVDAAIDRWVWYAGWTDKVAQVAGSSNPVAGPYFNFSVPEPTGVIGVLAPTDSSLLGLVSVVAPIVATANTVVVVADERRPVPAVTLTEVLATSDVPGGVVNLLTGPLDELAPVLAAHRDVDGIDLAGAPAELAGALEAAGATNIKRIARRVAEGFDWARDPGTTRLLRFVETKTVWHPIGI